jgi:uncharacterized protein DUF3310
MTPIYCGICGKRYMVDSDEAVCPDCWNRRTIAEGRGEALNQQIGGDHYKKLGIYQPWEVFAVWLTPEELRGYMKGTVIAYLAREKGGHEDIEKAKHTMELYLTLAKPEAK